jgi:hypothetical protein
MKQMNRFQEIIELNKVQEHVIAFIGLGSMHHINRLDIYSDIDFFMIVKDGFKDNYLNQVDWLEVSPIAWWYQETKDGLKVIYKDHIFLEFAVFTLDELKSIPFEIGTVYYKKEGFSEDLFYPSFQKKKKADVTHTINTWLSNLYIGLLRELRGEKVAAFLMIQVYATHQLLTLLKTDADDPFVVERRIEKNLLLEYQNLYTGYQGNIKSIKYQIKIMRQHFDIPQEFLTIILELLDERK